MQDATITLLHNPRCSKSREALTILESRHAQANIRHYLESPLRADELTTLIGQLQQPAAELIRISDARKLGLSASPESMTKEQICIWLAKFPESMQRPILIAGERAVIGRPPKNILPLLDNPKA